MEQAQLRALCVFGLLAVSASQPLASGRSLSATADHSAQQVMSHASSRPQTLRTYEVAVSAVRGKDGQISIGPQGHPDAIAEAVYLDSAYTASNMGHLEVWTWPIAGDSEQMYAAGYLEGWVMAERISQHFSNMWRFFNLTQDAAQWLSAQRQWLTGQLGAEATQGVAFWDAVRGVMQQFEGMVKGYNDRAASPVDTHTNAPHLALPPLTDDQLYFLVSNSDMSDVTAAIQYQKQQEKRPGGGTWDAEREGEISLSAHWSEMDAGDLRMELATGDRCSALIKVAPDFSDLWFGQSAWYTYAAMLRTFKHYDFAVVNPALKGRSMAFSSYPGQLSSDDDFYITGGNDLAVLQTTNRIFDQTLLSKVTNQAVLSWQRVRAALLVAEDGDSWGKAVATCNSGTYTNSWLVLALGLFKPGEALTPGLLTVVEQVPGNVWWEDHTQQLTSGYMGLYNVPVLPRTYSALGYPQFVKAMSARGPKYKEAVSGALWQVAPRAKIFRRDHGGITDLASMQRLMRSNNWKTDPFAGNVSTNQVCGRGDVDPTNPRAAGCYDSKVSDHKLAKSLEAMVINGPPHGPTLGPVFAWASSRYVDLVPHVGQPARFAFDWERMTPAHTLVTRRRAYRRDAVKS